MPLLLPKLLTACCTSLPVYSPLVHCHLCPCILSILRTCSTQSLPVLCKATHTSSGSVLPWLWWFPAGLAAYSPCMALVDSVLGITHKPPIEACPQSQQSACCWLAEEGSRESVDAKCRRLTATWVRERHVSDQDIEVCGFFEQLERAGTHTPTRIAIFCTMH